VENPRKFPPIKKQWGERKEHLDFIRLDRVPAQGTGMWRIVTRGLIYGLVASSGGSLTPRGCVAQAKTARPMEPENRKFARRDIDLAVQIEMADGSIVHGVVADVSQGGARLKISDPDGLPEQFMLRLSDKLHRWSRIAWRSAEEVGVEFLAAPKDPADDKTKPYVHIKCPRTGKDIWTGIRLTTANDLAKLSDVRRFAQCQYCKVVHGWTPREASLNAVP
jgi:hypothetical protein